MKFTKWTILRVLALAAVVAFIWCLNNDRLSLQNWSVPVDYLEDCPLYFGHLQAAAEGDFVPFASVTVRRLGAPYAANWNDWPSPGRDLVFIYGVLSKWIGLFPAANLSVLMAYITSALAFYAVNRLLRFRWEWAFMGAVLFAFTYIHAYRNLHHIVHTYSYAVPFALLSCWLVAFSRCKSWRDWRPWLCLATAAAVGIENPYNANMFGQLICLALLVQVIGARRKFNLVLGAACLGVLVIAFLAINANTLLYSWVHGKNPECLARGYYETELFGLKLTELVFPPLTHHIERLARLASGYARDQWYFRGEMFSPYLGWIGIAGMLWMAFEGLARLVKPRAFRSKFPAYLPLSLWVLVYSIIGGLNCILAFLVLPLFRGSNRYSIYLSALALLFLVSRLSLRSRRWQPGARYALAAALLLVGLFDELPRAVSPEATQAIAGFVGADRAFAKAMEEKLPPGAMVFQLPVVAFPEGQPVGGVQSYDMLRPYFLTRTLRFSFGSDKGRQREDWMKEVEKLPAAQMVRVLERYGFSAIYLNRKGFPDEAQGLLKQLADAGRSERIEDAMQEQVCVLLHPAATAELPPVSNRVLWHVKSGWAADDKGPNGEPRWWAEGEATLNFFFPRKPDPPACEFRCQLASLQSRRVSIELNGREVWSGNIAANTAVPVSVRLDGRPGTNLLGFKTDVVQLPSRSNPVPREYVVINPQMVTAGN